MELYHHGTKGMKWGVRRYQNPDGSYTEEGKRRRGTFGNRLKRNAGIRSSKALKEARSKNIDEMSTKELKEYNDRLNTEEQYVRLTKGSIGKGRDTVNQWGMTIATAIVTGIAIETGKAYVKNKMKRG